MVALRTLVENPSDTSEFSFWSLISGEVWKVRRPTELADILEPLKAYERGKLNMISLHPNGGTKHGKVDMPRAKVMWWIKALGGKIDQGSRSQNSGQWKAVDIYQS